jgi:hypothetical protein
MERGSLTPLDRRVLWAEAIRYRHLTLHPRKVFSHALHRHDDILWLLFYAVAVIILFLSLL